MLQTKHAISFYLICFKQSVQFKCTSYASGKACNFNARHALLDGLGSVNARLGPIIKMMVKIIMILFNFLLNHNSYDLISLYFCTIIPDAQE